MTRIAVVGAGAAGICAAKHLLAEGSEVVVYEMGSVIGGLWVYENDNGRSPAYRSLHINSEADVTSYEDFPFPRGTPLYPRHDVVRGYLVAYADHFGVTPHIRFHSTVERIEPAEDGQWRVRLARGAEELFDGVVVAPGHQAVPSHPPFRDDFTGEYLHVHEYRTPEPFTGKRVLVVGTGNSAFDAAADICTVTAATVMVARSPVLIMPRLLFGIPTARILAKIEKPWIPWPVRRQIRVLLASLAHGRMERWGLVTPKTRTHPASHPTLMIHAAYGRVEFRPDVASVSGITVRFTDGTAGDFDVMLAATGYELDLPFLSPALVPVRNRRLDLYKRVIVPRLPGLYFVGYFNVAGGANIRMMGPQARLVSAVVSGRVRLPAPEAMYADIKRERDLLKRRYPDRPRYGLELDPTDYRCQIDDLLASGATTGPPPAPADLRAWPARNG